VTFFILHDTDFKTPGSKTLIYSQVWTRVFYVHRYEPESTVSQSQYGQAELVDMYGTAVRNEFTRDGKEGQCLISCFMESLLERIWKIGFGFKWYHARQCSMLVTELCVPSWRCLPYHNDTSSIEKFFLDTVPCPFYCFLSWRSSIWFLLWQVKHNYICSPLNLVHFLICWIPDVPRKPSGGRLGRALLMVNPDGESVPDNVIFQHSGHVRPPNLLQC
jgi:hypothetical protein